MNKKNWTYLANGHRHKIGMLHSPSKGYLVIYCGHRLVQIDFQVFTDSTYSFMVDDELCHIHLRKNSGTFNYGFEIDEKADTGANKRRRHQFRKDLAVTILVFGTAIILFASGAYLFTSYQRSRHLKEINEALSRSGITVPATIIKLADPPGFFYKYQVKDLVYFEKLPKDLLGGLPLLNGEMYSVHCAEQDPQLHILKLDQPDPQLLDILLLRTIAAHRNANPEIPASRLICEVNQTFQSFGWSGLSHIYRQNVAPEVNKNFNKITWQKLINTPEYQMKVDSICHK